MLRSSERTGRSYLTHLNHRQLLLPKSPTAPDARTRLAALPIDHLVAEMAAFALASEAALRLRIVELDPELSGPTRDLWREAERQLLGSFPAFSVDEAVAIRDRIWFAGPAAGAVPLHRYLRELAGLFLEAHGPVARPRPPSEARQHASGAPRLAAPDPEPHDGRARWAWRWLSLALPPDLLLAGLAANGGPHAAIDLLSPVLRTQLRDREYAETHLHLGAAMDFPLLWLGALYAVASPETKANAFTSPGAALGEGSDLAPWLLRVAIARCVLAAYLKSPQEIPIGSPGSSPRFWHRGSRATRGRSSRRRYTPVWTTSSPDGSVASSRASPISGAFTGP